MGPTASDSTTGDKSTTSEGAGEGNDAWEAAQHILQAINFGSLQSIDSTASNPPMSAEGGLDLAALAQASNLAIHPESVRGVLTNDERASLQAQLALLAAQLSEIAEMEDEDDEEAEERLQQPHLRPQVQATLPLPLTAPHIPATPTVQALPLPPPVTASIPAVPPPMRPLQPPPPIIAATNVFMDINHFPDSSKIQSSTQVQNNAVSATSSTQNGTSHPQADQTEASDDDDMEMVEVPPIGVMDALRT